MTNFNHSYLADFGKVFFDAANWAITSSKALSANTTVNLILSSNPTEYKVIRTVCGVDADMNGMDYFTQVLEQSKLANLKHKVYRSQQIAFIWLLCKDSN